VSETYTQWICTTQPLCLCSDCIDDAECCCVVRRGVGDAGFARHKRCEHCNATMRLIDFETGEDAVS
jgi:hypothetical protein